MKQPLKSLTEYGPLVVFFVVFYWQGLIAATAVLVVTTLLAAGATYYSTKKIPMTLLITALIVTVFGGLTVFSGDETFIKIKPTLINLVFAAILLGGWIRGKGLLKHVFESGLHMNDAAWRRFSLHWAIFFLVLAGLNELVWRSFPTEIWVEFKVFGLLGLTFLFMLVHIPFLQKYTLDVPKQDDL